MPLGHNHRYDCVIDDGARLLRVQIKTGFGDGYGAIRWATRSVRFYDGAARDYRGGADLFAVWVPELRRCFLVPVEDCGRREACLRLLPARNGQRRRTRNAADYELLSNAPRGRSPSPSIGSRTRL